MAINPGNVGNMKALPVLFNQSAVSAGVSLLTSAFNADGGFVAARVKIVLAASAVLNEIINDGSNTISTALWNGEPLEPNRTYAFFLPLTHKAPNGNSFEYNFTLTAAAAVNLLAVDLIKEPVA